MPLRLVRFARNRWVPHGVGSSPRAEQGVWGECSRECAGAVPPFLRAQVVARHAACAHAARLTQDRGRGACDAVG